MSRTRRDRRVYPDPYRFPKIRSHVRSSQAAADELQEQGLRLSPRMQTQTKLYQSSKVISCYREGRTLEEQQFLRGTTLVRGRVGSPMADCFFVEMTHDDYCRVWWISCPRNPMVGDIIVDFDGSRYEVLSVYKNYGMTLRWVGRG